MLRSLVVFAATAGTAIPALAQGFSGLVAFRDDHANSTVPTIPNGGIVAPFIPMQSFAVMLGVFDSVGSESYGLFSFTGSITAEGGGVQLGNFPGTRTPFTFIPGGNGTIGPGAESINNIHVGRNPLFTTAWPPDEVPAFPEHPHGNNAYFSAFRFTLGWTDVSQREIVVTVSGELSAIVDFILLGGDDGIAEWVAVPSAPIPVSGSFRILVPAPGAAALLGLGGLLAARRRRGEGPSPARTIRHGPP